MADINPNRKDATSQKKEMLKYFYAGGVLTKENAKQLFGAEDYRKRVSELRDEGHPIEDRWVTGISRYGHPCRFKEYFVAKEALA